MNYRYISCLSTLVCLATLTSCANRQEEAARLEREMLNQDTALTITSLKPDSQAASGQSPDIIPSADAIPPSEDVPANTDMAVETLDAGSQSLSSIQAKDSVLSLVASQMESEAEKPISVEVAPVEVEASEVAPSPMPRRDVVGKYTVQIAASISESYALGLVDLYTRRGFEPYIDSKEISGRTWYRVRVGHFDRVAEAETTRDKLVDKYSLQAWVDNIPQ